jgi:hypothetical protein
MRSYTDFCNNLVTIPWLERLGQPHPRDRMVCRIHDWDLWLGPEDPAVALMMDVSVHWQEQLEQAVGNPDVLRDHWNPIEARVLELAKPKVPYAVDQDPWYGPNAAVWSAAWTAALAGCWVWHYGGLAQPDEDVDPDHQWRLAEIWRWYADGHWPCSFYWTYDTDRDTADRITAPRRLVVF